MAKKHLLKQKDVHVVAGTLGTKKKLKAFEKAVCDVVDQHSNSNTTACWNAASHPCLQIADYCCWAIKRKSDSRSFDIVKPKLRTHDVPTWYGPNEVLLGVPAYDDAGVGYHDPGTENSLHALCSDEFCALLPAPRVQVAIGFEPVLFLPKMHHHPDRCGSITSSMDSQARRSRPLGLRFTVHAFAIQFCIGVRSFLVD